jgi:replicative DNA helicase
MPELVSEVLHRHENHAAACVSTGLPHLDHLLSIRQGALVVLAARPSVGKTALATQITLNVARNGKSVVFFSLEMDAASIVQRLIAAHAGKLPGHARDMFEQQAILERAAEVASLPVFLDDNPRLSLPMVQARLRRMAAAPNPPALAVLDYLQLLPGGEKRGGWRTREEEVSAVSRGLKLLARETGIPVLVCAQLNRDVERAAGTRLPKLSDLRESGAIEQDADAVMLLHPEDAGEVREPTVRLKLLLEKQREGPTGLVHLRFHRPSSRFETFQPEAEPQTQDE